MEDEGLIPNRREIPWRIVPPAIWVSIAFLVAFAALGVSSQSVHEPARRFALLARWETPIPSYARATSVDAAFTTLTYWVPALSGLVMLWIAFLSPRRSDRTLWSAAMIFTAYELAADGAHFFARRSPDGMIHTYPNVAAVVGLIAYGGWLLILRESTLPVWLKRLLSGLCLLAVLVILAYPAINAYTRTVDLAGSVLFAGSLFALGIFVARRVGVDLLARNASG
ncbi:MAG: hypothetical protein WAJ94_07255 [Candidatus Cybelea sp.]